MWSKIRTLLLILSLSMNGAFLAVWLVHVVPSHFGASRQPAAQHEQNVVWCPVHREIGVSLSQWKEIEPKLLEFQRKVKGQKEVIIGLRNQMLGLLSSPQVAPEAVRAKQDEIVSALRGMQDLVIAHMLEEKRMLTPEQQQRLFEIARKNSGELGCRILSGVDPDIMQRQTDRPHEDGEQGNILTAIVRKIRDLTS